MKSIRERLGKEILIFDGACGTVFQTRGLRAGERPEVWCIEKPSEVIRLHREYIEAGADIIKTVTFGANSLRYTDEGKYSVEEIVGAAVSCARQAVDECGKNTYIALDIGPSGQLIGTQDGTDFEDVLAVFARTVRAGSAGCDLVLIETFGDMAETRAAILAARENCDLPVVVTNVYGENGRTFTGSDAAAMCRVAEGLHADAVGMNCSLGPEEMLKLLPELTSATSLPIAVNPNAGLPSVDAYNRTVYEYSSDRFVSVMENIVRGGASLVGGCCGTTPAYIDELSRRVRNMPVTRPKKKKGTFVSSSTRTVSVGENGVSVIGERINPTGKSKFKAALQVGDFEYAVGEAHNQAAAGADILDVNVGIPEIDEKEVLVQTVERIQAVCDLPLQIDTSSPSAMEYALRRYNGRALINSVNGSEASMAAVLPLAAKYGGVVIVLTLDENGIPDTPVGRADIAGRVIARAAEYGIGPEDVIVDPLTLTLGADPLAAEKTLEAMKLIKTRYGVKCSLGVSNISFGLPDREKVNCDFLAAALEAGMDAAIMNPNSAAMMEIARSGAADPEAMKRLGNTVESARRVEFSSDSLSGCIFGGLKERASDLAREKCHRVSPMEVIRDDVIPALELAGKRYESGEIFLPGLLSCADAAIASLSVVTDAMLSTGETKRDVGKVILATVEGDVHDIGKNIVAVMLKSYGFEVIDLGRDVPARTVLEVCKESGASVVGLSALMTTTVPAMENTIQLLKSELKNVNIVVGGAVLTEEYAARIGADRYARDAMATVRYAEEIYS